MKRHWKDEELTEHWTLLGTELPPLVSKSDHNRLGFAVLLKFFQMEACFPEHKRDVPNAVVAHLARQLGLSLEDWLRYDWEGRTVKEHRAQIRTMLGFRRSTECDAERLAQWLIERILPTEPQNEQIVGALYRHLRTERIEPPAPARIERLVRSALRTFEQHFYTSTLLALPPECLGKLDALVQAAADTGMDVVPSALSGLGTDPGRAGLQSMLNEIDKLKRLKQLGLPMDLFVGVSAKVLARYRSRAAAEPPRELRAHPAPVRYTLLAVYCRLRQQEITDGLVELLVSVVHRMASRAERKTEKVLLCDLKRVGGKSNLLFQLAEAALEHPEGIVREVLYPVVGEKTLKELVREFKASGSAFRHQMQTRLRGSYSRHYRRMVPEILGALEFRSNNAAHQPVVDALALLGKYKDSARRLFAADERVPIEGVVPASWQPMVLVQPKSNGKAVRVERVGYEICVLQALREKLRCRETWVVGANRYRDPDRDLPTDFDTRREEYCITLKQPLEADTFVADVQQEMATQLERFDTGVPKNSFVKLLERGDGRIHLSPLLPQSEPVNLTRLKLEMVRRWPMTSLLDILKEADLAIGFTDHFKSVASREHIDRAVLQRRLLLCLYALGTNAGLKRVSAGDHGIGYQDLRYVRRRFIDKEQLRAAIVGVANAIFSVRLPQIWGEGTTACTSDSKKFGSWDQNLMTEWHIRYGGRGVMIYWHVERKSTCIYSQLKSCSSSEVSAMIEGVLRHCTEMSVEKNYVDTHGQSEVAFAFCHLLGFQLLPRLKSIHAQKLYRAPSGSA